MKKQKLSTVETVLLRTRTEKLVKPKSVDKSSAISESEVQKRLHELEFSLAEKEALYNELLHVNNRNERALKNYSQIYDQVPVGIFTLTRSGEITHMNPCGSQMIGCEPGHTNKSTFISFVSGNCQPDFHHFLAKLFSGFQDESCEITLITIKNELLHVLITGHHMIPGDECFISVMDITRRVKAEAKNNLTEARQRRFIDSEIIGIVIADAEGRFIEVNNYFLNLIGFTRDEFENGLINWSSITPSEWLQNDENAMREMRECGICTPYEKEYIRRDGTRIAVLITDAILPGPEEHMLGFILDITERKRVQDALLESNELLLLFMKHSPIYAYIKEVSQQESRVKKASENYIDMIGVSGTEMVGKTMDELFPLEFATKITADDWEVVSAGKAFELEEELNGRYYKTIKFPIPLEGKNLLAGYTIDITEQRQAEEALKLNQEELSRQIDLFSLLLKNLQIGIFMVEAPSGKPLVANEAAKKLLGRGILPYVTGTNLAEVYKAFKAGSREPYPPEEMPILKGISGITSYIDDLMVLQPDGTEILLEIFGSPVVDKEGKVWASLVSFMDITERKKAEDALRQSRELYRDLIDLAVDGVLVGSNDGVIIDANSYICSLSGRSRDELIGKHISDSVFSPESLKLFPMQFDRLKNGEVVVNERNILRPDGVEIPIEMRTKMMPNGTYQSFLRDITGRKNVEAILQQKNQELSKINAEKDKFFSIIAHDLRSPFNVFLGWTQMMVEDLPKLTIGEIQGMAESMRSSAVNLYSLLENLLEWSRLQRGIMKFRPRSFQLVTIVTGTLRSLIDLAAEKGVDIYLDIPKEIIVFADSNMVSSIIRNLVSNALKFTHKGGLISIKAVSLSGNRIEISIEDSGIGMNADLIEKLFHLDEKTNRKGTAGEASTGLGLILCRDFIEKHGSSICVESEPDKGSRFYFSIPEDSELE